MAGSSGCSLGPAGLISSLGTVFSGVLGMIRALETRNSGSVKDSRDCFSSTFPSLALSAIAAEVRANKNAAKRYLRDIRNPFLVVPVGQSFLPDTGGQVSWENLTDYLTYLASIAPRAPLRLHSGC